MGGVSSSGLLYLAILGAWGVYLASRCLRTPAHQVESLPPADGAVLQRRGRPDRYAAVDEPEPPVVPVVKNRRADLGPRGGRPLTAVAEAAARRAAAPIPPVRVSRATARRRRRMVWLLLLALLATSVTAGLALTSAWSVAVPALLLATYLVELRAQARRARARLAVLVQPVPLPVDALAPDVLRVAQRSARAGSADDEFVDLWPVFDDPAARVKDAPWEPVPVPLPTYVTAPKAPERPAFAGRRIDMTPGRPWVTSATEDTQELPVVVAAAGEAAEAADEKTEELTQKKAVNG